MNKKVQMGKNVILYPGVTFFGDGKIVIGDNVKIGSNTIIYASESGGVDIGKNTIIAAQNYIIDANHKINMGELIQSQGMDVKKILIGEDVWLGCDVSVIPGAELGNGVVVGAKALVNSKIPEYSIVVGCPGRVIKKRS